MGADFNVPLRAQLVGVLPSDVERSFYSVERPNVQIVTVKTQAENVIRGEVSSAPLNPPVNKIFVIRLQEFAGKGGPVMISIPAKLRSAVLMNLTESEEIGRVEKLEPLTVNIKPFEAATVRIEID